MAATEPGANDVGNFYRASGRTITKEVRIKASTAIEDGAIVYPDPAGVNKWTLADSTAGENFGVIREAVASTDSDYASSTKTKLVEFPSESGVEWFGTVGAGTFAEDDVNKYVDLNDSISVDVDTSTKDQLYVAGFISSTRGRFIFAGNVPAGKAMPATS